MSKIEFKHLSISSNRVDVEAITDNSSYDLYFEFSQDIPISSTAVGIAMSTLCGRAFSHVGFDFPIDPIVLPAIKELTHAQIVCEPGIGSVPGRRQGNLLSFSGGFDSLAAKILMPADTMLVSMDFGGRFARERNFFESFNVLRVSTNIVDTPLRRNSWSFMGIGAILASDYFRAKYHTFGGILEAGVDNMRKFPVAARANTFPPFKASGYVNAPYVLGLTEIGTLRVMLQQDAALVARSLPSVASPGEEKLYRKAVLADVVAGSLDIPFTRGEVSAPKKPHFAFGQNFALDLLTLYVISLTGDSNAMGLADDIPSPIAEFAKQKSMKFMERANPTLFENFPKELAPALHLKLAESGIQWYTEQDWIEFSQIRDLLAEHHSALRL